MGFIVGLMTVILTINCLFLILLILIQLPKKEAGIGTAFGGATTDALFGAGAGNALTNLTKYSATLFFALALILSIINANRNRADAIRLRLSKPGGVPASVLAPPPATSNLLARPSTPATPPVAALPSTPAKAPGASNPLLVSPAASSNMMLTPLVSPKPLVAPTNASPAKPATTKTNAEATPAK